MTYREIIDAARELRPHSLTDKVQFFWLKALDGRLAASVFQMAPVEFRKRDYTFPDAMDYEPLVDYPHQELYLQYLVAQIDLAMGENEQYQNDITVFNQLLSGFRLWFANAYAPGQGYSGRCGCGPGGHPPYYLSAYGLAVSQGYEGTLEQWLRSLEGDSVELRVVDNVLQYRLVPQMGEAPDTWERLYDLEQLSPDLTQVKADVTQLQKAVLDMQYEPIRITSIRNSSPVNELGQTITGVELFFNTNKTPITTLLDGVEVANDPEWAGTDNGSYSADKTWTVTVTDERGAQATARTTAKFYNGIYYGAAPELPAEGTLLGYLTKKLWDDLSMTFTADAAMSDWRLWFLAPARLGVPKFVVGGIEGGFETTVLDWTNAFGYTEKYILCMSSRGGLGVTTVTVSKGSEWVPGEEEADNETSALDEAVLDEMVLE